MTKLFLTVICFFGSLSFLWSQSVAPFVEDVNKARVELKDVVVTNEHKERYVFGVVKDLATGEPIVGATVIVDGTTLGAVSGLDGEFKIVNVPKEEFKVVVSYISYKSYISDALKVKDGNALELNLSMVEEAQNLETVVVVGRRRIGSEAGIMSAVKTSAFVASGISAAQIARSNDRDASE
ncbi:MAG: carboxypeptidase-like regulatory domain-containing protein, partial [Rikenellaceae bacterium]